MPEWNHNNHYHVFLLKHVPTNCAYALDIGCGAGHFAYRLAAVCQKVDAVDADKDAILYGRNAFSSSPNITFYCGKFEDVTLPTHQYDFVSVIATLHHMDTASALDEMKQRLRPGGVLAILGLYKEATVVDLLYSVISIPLNLMFQHIKNSDDVILNTHMITTSPKETLKEICQTAHLRLPGSRLRRHLFWRYSLIWQKPLS